MADPAIVRALEGSGALLRITASLAADELGVQRRRALAAAERRGWGPDTRMDEEGIGADSLARLRIGARLNRFFHLHESGVEDYLLLAPTLGEWAALAAEGLRRGGGRLTFLTGGSTGEPRPAEHALEALAAEAEGHGEILGQCGRVALLTPPHHIYGFLFGALGPALRGTPVLDLVGAAPGGAAARLADGDAIIATPFLWEVLEASGAPLPGGALGITSTAPCPPPLWDRLSRAGLGGLAEIYGSSETAGLGWRRAAEEAFQPLPHLERSGRMLVRKAGGAALAPPDHIEWTEAGFRPTGRRDGAVQVGGVNVFPGRVRDWLRAQDGVEDAAVRLDGAGGDARLKAFVVTGADHAGLEAALRAAMAAELTPPERPQRLAFGAALPRDSIGKAADWDAPGKRAGAV